MGPLRGQVERYNDNHNSSICPSAGRFWSDAFGADTDANAAWWSEPLDAALPTNSRASWGRRERPKRDRAATQTRSAGCPRRSSFRRLLT